MYRLVTVHIAPGRAADYWSWAERIVDLWTKHDVPVVGIWRTSDDSGDLGLWLTEHASEEDETALFRAMYSTPEGAALIAERPPLVSTTDVHRLEKFFGRSPAQA